MKLKSLLLGLTFSALLTASSLYAQTSTFTLKEMNTLATIAAIDENEILVSSVAVNKTSNSGVISFAKMMITQHSNNLTQILSMANNPNALAIALSNGSANGLLSQGNEGLTTLGALQGSLFDQAYVNAMVTGHKDALNLIDTKLMKTASSAEMKQFLTSTRAVVVQHLEHAQALQQKIGS